MVHQLDSPHDQDRGHEDGQQHLGYGRLGQGERNDAQHEVHLRESGLGLAERSKLSIGPRALMVPTAPQTTAAVRPRTARMPATQYQPLGGCLRVGVSGGDG